MINYNSSLQHTHHMMPHLKPFNFPLQNLNYYYLLSRSLAQLHEIICTYLDAIPI